MELMIIKLDSFETQSTEQAEQLRKVFLCKLSFLRLDNAGFMESNKMHQINGYMYGDMGLELCKDKRVLWYGLSFGTEIDIHSMYFSGNNIEHDGGHKDSIMLFPGIRNENF